jgi:flagellar basal-body rod protein FlgC
MGLFDAFDAAGSALVAERLRLDVTADNIANAQSTGYRRKDVVLRPGASFDSALRAASGVQVAGIVQDATPARRVYDPGHPDAGPDGYRELPNVDTVREMTELIGAQRAYEANVTAMQTAKALFAKTLELLR